MTETVPENVEITESVLYQKMQDEVVLLNMDNQEYYGLNCVGAELLDSLISLKSIAAVSERICTIYDVDAEAFFAPLGNCCLIFFCAAEGRIVMVDRFFQGFVHSIDNMPGGWLVGVANAQIYHINAASYGCLALLSNFREDVGWNRLKSFRNFHFFATFG